MSSETKINCIITGAGGFIGQALASALLEDPLLTKLTLTDVFEPSPPKSKVESKVEVRCLKADLTSLETCQSTFTPDLNLIYILHGIMSGAAEANFELGLKVNLDSTRQILDILRQTNPGVKVIYPSSLAVYGPPATSTTKITELNAPVPGSSYGAQKHICETLLDDYSRRGFLDGRTCRLPTVSSDASKLDR
jgi:nucleoside-diphosphate-sugar epimerase